MQSKTWSKLRALAALVTVFLLVLATNKMDQNHFEEVQESFASVYQDRLVAKNHIFKISRLLDIKKNDLISDSIGNMPYSVNDSIRSLVTSFERTRLTYDEQKSFDRLKIELEKLYDVEQNGVRARKAAQIISVLRELDQLADIQMLEARKELKRSNRLIESSNLISSLEIGALVLIGFIIQLLIFVKPWK